MEKGSFAIKPTLGPFDKHIGTTTEEKIILLKCLIDKYQKEIEEVCKSEFKYVPHSLQMYFEVISPLILARDLKYLTEKLEEGSIDASTLHTIAVGYETLIDKFKKNEALNQVLDATEKSNIHTVVGFEPSVKSVLK